MAYLAKNRHAQEEYAKFRVNCNTKQKMFCFYFREFIKAKSVYDTMGREPNADCPKFYQ